MLDRCSAEGKRSPWLAGNQARALALLNRRDEAMVIWKALAGSAHDAVSNSAQSMLERLEAEQLNELRNQWLQLAQAAGESLPEVEAAESSALADLERPVLEASIRLRKQGSVELSLQLLEAAVDAGLSSPWIDDNRARALVSLGRRTEAIALWSALVEHPEQSLRNMAQELVDQQTLKQLQELKEQLSRIGLEQGWVSEELHHAAESMEALEQAVLKESIRSRDAGQAATSLLLIEAAQAGGMHSPWLKDNQARALVHLKRLPEAVALWRELEALPDQETLAAMARDMLQTYSAEADRLASTNKAQELADEGQIEQAKTLLVRSMLADPGWDGYTTKLIEVLKTERGHIDDADLLERELEEDQLNLEAFDVYLDLVEQRLKDAAASSST